MKTQSNKALFVTSLVLALSGCTSEGVTDNIPLNARLAPGDFQGINFSYNPSPLAIEETEKIQFNEGNAAEFARLALVKATAYAVNALVNTRSLEFSELFFEQGDTEESSNCSGGGNLVISKLDARSNGVIDPEDTFIAQFNECQNADGVLRTDFATYSGSARSGGLTTDHYVTANSFKGTQPSTGVSVQSDGAEGRRIVLGSGRFQYIVHAPANRIMEKDGTNNSANYLATTFLDIQGSRQGQNPILVRMNYKEKGDVSTRLELSENHAYTALGDNLNVTLADNAVSNGTLEIVSGGRIVVQALGNSSGSYRVRVGLDADTDGNAEKTCDFDYRQLVDAAASFTDQTCGAPTGVGPINQLPLRGLMLIGPVLDNLLNGLLSR